MTKIFGGKKDKEEDKNDDESGTYGRRSIKIKQRLSKDDFQIVDKLGSGAFGSVYGVIKKDGIKEKGRDKLYAMKILDKEKVLK